MNRNKLMELTPDKWGLLVYLSNSGMVDLDRVKTAMKEIANTRLAFAQEIWDKAKQLKALDPTDGLIINRSYYCMYHAARAAVYVRLQLDVEKHQALIEKFEKLLIREFDDTTLSDTMDDLRMNRNECDYNPLVTATVELCNNAIQDAEIILNTCKNLVEGF
ncbi:MAG: HEPN domain-containing protein [Methanosarcinales archaeon]